VLFRGAGVALGRRAQSQVLDLAATIVLIGQGGWG
jgi:hypothetical protein